MATLKYSRQRESIKEFLMQRNDHPTADTVYENLRLIYPNISLGTVYRNLSLLADIGEIRKLPSLTGADRFDGHVEAHPHFICTCCNKVMDLHVDGIDTLVKNAAKDFNGTISDCSANFYGLCEDCAKREKSLKES